MNNTKKGGKINMINCNAEILRSRKNEGTSNLCNSIDESGEHCSKLNMIVGERQIPYIFMYKWNLMNKTNKQAIITSDIKIKNKLTVGVRGVTGEKGEGLSRNMYKRHMDKVKGGRIEGRKCGWVGCGEW